MQNQNIENLLELTNFQEGKKIKYLGITFTKKTSTLLKDNYLKLIEEIKKDLTRWGNLQLSLLGRVATIKMNILPKLLFLFQTIPIVLKQTIFKKLEKCISKFVWQGKKIKN